MDERYNRQRDIELMYPKKIMIAGCGGVGYNVAKIAALSGIKDFYLYDDDTLQTHNLNRIDVSADFLGMNKAEMTSKVIKGLRSDIFVLFYPFKLNKITYSGDPEYIIDCTDDFKAQKEIYKIALHCKARYMKAGYDGEHISIHNKPASWDYSTEDDNGYTITPSWSVPAVMIACLAVAKLMKYQDCTISTNIKSIMEGF